MYELIRKSGQWNLVSVPGWVVQGVNAVVSQVPMPHFTAILRNLHFPSHVTARDNLYAHDVCIVCDCGYCFLFAVVFCMPSLVESEK